MKPIEIDLYEEGKKLARFKWQIEEILNRHPRRFILIKKTLGRFAVSPPLPVSERPQVLWEFKWLEKGAWQSISASSFCSGDHLFEGLESEFGDFSLERIERNDCWTLKGKLKTLYLESPEWQVWQTSAN